MVSILGEDFEPCYSKDLSEVRLCTKQLNEMNFTIPAGEGMELKYLVEEPALPVSNEEYAINYIREILRKIQEAIERILK